jgi:tripartite-type tricarboxylate transporter receptor subunit TctC
MRISAQNQSNAKTRCKHPKYSEISYFYCLLAPFPAQWAPRLAPSHPLTDHYLYQPLPPSGAADAFGLTLAKELSTPLNDPIVVDNRSGAGDAVRAEHHSIAPSMYVNLS